MPGQDNGQHEFETQTGINIETDIDHVVACLLADASGNKGPGAGLVLARGTFNEVKIEALMREHGARGRAVQGQAADRRAGTQRPNQDTPAA